MVERSKAVFVTGASSGIGRSCVDLLVANGHKVFAGVRNQEDLDWTNQALRHGSVVPIVIDVRSTDAVKRAVELIAKQFSGTELAGVVNCAGVSLPGPLEMLDPEEVLDAFNVNVVGQLRVTQAMLPMLRAGGGRVVMIGSTSGSIPGAFTGGYSASKFALTAMTRVMRAEFAASGISVSMIDPGAIGTPFWGKTLDHVSKLLTDERHREVPDQTRVALAAWSHGIATLSGDWPDPEQVARTVLHALTAKRPRFRYVVGVKAKVKLLVWRFLPEVLKDAVLRRAVSVRQAADQVRP